MSMEFPVTCGVCGGEGVGTIKTAAAAWDARVLVSHSNPAVCADNLQYKAAKQREELRRSLENASMKFAADKQREIGAKFIKDKANEVRERLGLEKV